MDALKLTIALINYRSSEWELFFIFSILCDKNVSEGLHTKSVFVFPSYVKVLLLTCP